MKKVIFHIDSENEHSEIVLNDELTIGRTSDAQIVLPDSGLSRLNTTIFRDGDEVFVVDENSTNGTFVNGEQIFSRPHLLNDRDEITIGTNTLIYVEIFAEKKTVTETKPPPPPTEKKQKKAATAQKTTEENKLPLIPIIAGSSIFFIIFIGVIALFLIKPRNGGGNGNSTPSPIQAGAIIPMRVIDPLGGEDPDDIDDLIAALDRDIADEIENTSDLAEVQNNMKTSNTGNVETELIVKPEFFTDMINLAKASRSPSGERPPGLNVRQELCCGVPKQTAKLEQMVKGGYTQPLDFADLAERRLNGELIELPVATQYYVLDVGGNATEAEFNEFSWKTSPRAITLAKGSDKYKILQRLAENFGGQKYDLENPSHRRQMKIRLLRMFNKAAKPILEEFAKAYQQKFNRPLRITSLTRSMEYQISLNGNNPNSFKVGGEGSRPPHTSGCAFDLARKQMTTEEQNFMIEEFAKLENRGVLDALIEYNANACFHIFIYPDGKPPGK